MVRADETVENWTAEQRLARATELSTRHHEVVFRYAFRLSGCRATAEDICQEVFLRAFRAIEQLRDVTLEKAWLMAITRNEFARWCRSKAAQRSSYVGQEPVENQAGTELAVEVKDWVQAALELLPVEFRAVVLMYYFEQLSYVEIAEQLEIPLGTVMSRLNRGKHHLKRCLDEVALPH